MKEIPKKLLIVGGGIIGLEMATVYHALGSEISVVELMDQIIPGCDKDLVTPLYRRIKKQYKNIWLETSVTSIEADQDGLKVSFEGKGAPESEVFDAVLVAVGRRPNGKLIGAEQAGVNVDEHGFIAVDKQQRTNVAAYLCHRRYSRKSDAGPQSFSRRQSRRRSCTPGIKPALMR